MIEILASLFIKNKDYANPETKRAYGVLCGTVGIVLNILLFTIKFIAGALSGSLAITADAFNNLSDSMSSLISLIGFKISGKEPDSDHPFGHGRYEYISGLVVSFLVILMGFELAKSSVGKILNPTGISFSIISLVILLISIFVKLYMVYYNKSIGKKILSASMSATAADSISDAISTLTVLISMLLFKFFHINVDAYCGCLVSIFIIYTGIKSAAETTSTILGQKANPETIKKIQEITLSFPEAIGIHDLIVHDYGCGAMIVSLHVEVDANGDILEIHDAIDNIEREISEQLKCSATIHMDPIVRDNPEITELQEYIGEFLNKNFDGISIHDFRLVKGQTHTNIIFDIVVPYTEKNPEKITNAIKEHVKNYSPSYFAVINVDRSF